MTRSHAATITLYNYRCFSDKKPAVIEIRRGLTGYVGPNNAGKSTVLRVFRELRNVFGMLNDPSIVTELVTGSTRQMQLNDLEDPAEIEHRGSQGRVIVDIKFPVEGDTDISAIRLSAASGANAWEAKFWYGPDNSEIAAEHARQHGLRVKNRGGGLMPANIDAMQQFARLVTRSMYIPAFRHALEVSGGSHPDLLIGSDFVSTWHTWQAGQNIANRSVLRKVVDDVSGLLGISGLGVQVASGPNTLQVSVNGRDFRLRELGAGIAQFLIILGNVAFRKPSIIFIDEPELNLHPSLQTDFLTILASYSDYGVVFATHSMGLGPVNTT